MRLAFVATAWEDYLYWQQTDEKTLLRINDLLKETMRQPFSGIGKPEPLRGTLQGFWSRRITKEHRLVYQVIGSGSEQTLVIVQCRYHY